MAALLESTINPNSEARVLKQSVWTPAAKIRRLEYGCTLYAHKSLSNKGGSKPYISVQGARECRSIYESDLDLLPT